MNALEIDSELSRLLHDVLKLLIVVAVSCRGRVDAGLELGSDENDISRDFTETYDSINFNAFAPVIAHCRKSRAVHMLLMACRVFGKRVKIFFDSTSAPNGDTKSQVI